MKKMMFLLFLMGCVTDHPAKQTEMSWKNLCQEFNSRYQNMGSPQKMLLVRAANWNDFQAKAQILEKDKENKWQEVGNAFDVVLGKNGQALGYQWSHRENLLKAPVKKEGDGKTPFGLHLVGKKFGFAENKNQDEDYYQITENTFCVDDINSPYYNQVVNLDTNSKLKINWTSAEKMKTVPVYSLGAEVDYQSNAATQSGSCIFLHLWENPEHGTAGCIAMEKANLENALSVKNKNTSMVLAVLTEEVYAGVKDCF